MKSFIVVILTGLMLTACGTATANAPIDTAYTKAERSYLANLEQDTGTIVLEPRHMINEAASVCRTVSSTVFTKTQLITFLGAYALTNYDGRGTMTGKVVADMLLFSCPATAERMLSIYQSGA